MSRATASPYFDRDQFRGMRRRVRATQGEVALHLRVEPRQVSRWERGVEPIPYSAGLALRAWVEDKLGSCPRCRAYQSGVRVALAELSETARRVEEITEFPPSRRARWGAEDPKR